ncbi:type II toxin-antitoxin system VapC family toxin [Rhodoferax antarcticus]|uniref:type II toxin-antitoxin system VapC family toxin n=1 Tax=Rhodoferax antarcticus TaxID=81479 RepID=UPI001A7E0894|nr:PIN domain-containing protein [Rhodoferax antarcticus]
MDAALRKSTVRFAKSMTAGAIDMQRVYLDANATIYFVEKAAPHYPGIRNRMTDAHGKPMVHCVISELLLMDVRVKPLREQDQATLASFERYFAAFSSQTVSMDKSVFELATHLRVSHSIKTPDALHLAAAIHAGCDQFWTNDSKLIRAAEGRIEVINIGEPHGTNT